MNNDSSSHSSADHGPFTSSSPALHRYIACTLMVSARHLPWAISQQIHAGHQNLERGGTFSAGSGSLVILELEAYSWRVDVTNDSIAAALVLGWHELHRLLQLAQRRGCEALELAKINPALPAVLDFTVFSWPEPLPQEAGDGLAGTAG
jgi:hypothetical protein